MNLSHGVAAWAQVPISIWRVQMYHAVRYVMDRVKGPAVDRIMKAEMKRMDDLLEKRASGSAGTSGSSPEKSASIPAH